MSDSGHKDGFLGMVKERESDECRCGRRKKPGNAFCYWCTDELPFNMRRELEKPVGDGFEAAFEEAVNYFNGQGIV